MLNKEKRKKFQTYAFHDYSIDYEIDSVEVESYMRMILGCIGIAVQLFLKLMTHYYSKKKKKKSQLPN